MLSQEFVDKVKKSTDMLELAREYTFLEVKGDGIWAGKCPHPEHEDDTPSFTVWAKNQSWACMACHYGRKNLQEKNYGSDCIAFIQWIEKLSWQDAVLFLAKRKNIPKPSSEQDKAYKRNKILADVYHKSLNKSSYNYLYSRGLDDEDIKKWNIGFFNGRITFPLMDKYKNVLGFSTRIFYKMNTDEEPKYKNSTNSTIFNKSLYFYGMQYFDTEFDEIRITEGATDVILSNKYKVKNIVCTLGTSFTEGHVENIKFLKKTPVFCMDGDLAGLRSIKKNIEILAKENIYSKILILPTGKDMAEMALLYKENLEEYIQENAITYGYYKIQEIMNQYDSQLNELKLKIYPKIKQVLKTIPHEEERQVLSDFVYDKINVNIK